MTPPWLRLAGLLIAVLIGLLSGSRLRMPWLLLAAGGAAAAGGLLLVRRGRWPLLLVASLLLAAARGAAVVHVPSPATLDYYRGGLVAVRGWLDEPPERHRSAIRLHLRLTELATADQPARPIRGRLLLTTHAGGSRFAYGDRVEAQGMVFPVGSSDRFDYADYLSRSEIWAVLRNPSVRVLGHSQGNPVYGILLRIKERFLTGVRQALPEPQAALVLGIVLGYRTALPADLEQRMIDTGLIHIVVISGLKVAIFAGIVQRLCFRVIPRAAAPAAVGAVAAYVVIAGASAAAVRAGLMGSAGLVGRALHRDTQPIVSLLVMATAMLLVQPAFWRDVSFQLSFLGTAGIVLFTDAIRRRIPLLPGIVAEPFAVTVAAQAATLPVMAQNFGVVSVVGPLANALVLPALPAVIAIGGAGGLLGGWLAWAGYLPLQAAGWICAYIAGVVNVLGAWPLAAAPAPTFPAPLVAGYYLSLGAGVAGYRLRTWFSRPLVWAGLAALAVVTVVLALARPDGRLQVTALDVGTGSGVLIQGPRGEHVLLNGGPDADRLAQSLGRAMPPGARRLDAVILSGGRRVEVAGLGELFTRYRVARLYVSGEVGAFTLRQLVQAARQHGVPVETLDAGTAVEMTGVEVRPLPLPETAAWSIRWGARTVLVLPPGPEEPVGSPLAPDALILAAGGPERLPPAWLTGSPTVAIQVARLSRDGAPPRSLLRQLAAAPSVRVLRTDQAGNIGFSTNGRDFRVRP